MTRMFHTTSLRRAVWLGLIALIVGIQLYALSFGPTCRKILGESPPDARHLRTFHRIYGPFFESAMHLDWLAKGIMAEAGVPGSPDKAELAALRRSLVERGIVTAPSSGGFHQLHLDIRP